MHTKCTWKHIIELECGNSIYFINSCIVRSFIQSRWLFNLCFVENVLFPWGWFQFPHRFRRCGWLLFNRRLRTHRGRFRTQRRWFWSQRWWLFSVIFQRHPPHRTLNGLLEGGLKMCFFTQLAIISNFVHRVGSIRH